MQGHETETNTLVKIGTSVPVGAMLSGAQEIARTQTRQQDPGGRQI